MKLDEPIHLIAHKVRGQAALDVAVPMQMHDGVWWIIPTSGHRAYPYWSFPMENLFAYKNIGDPPQDLRDHYTIADAIRPTKAQAAALAHATPRPEDL